MHSTARSETRREVSEGVAANGDANGKGKGNGKGKPRKSNTPFQRVKADGIEFVDDRLKDNTFESRVRLSILRCQV